jgi:hypothetical protein
MNQTQALSALKKILGPKLGYRINPKAATAEEREEAQAQRPELRAAREAAQAAMEARRLAILEGDAEYQRLKAEWTKAKKAAEENAGASTSYRITVGTVSDVGGLGFFHVKAEGDNWDDVITKLRDKS